VSANLAFYKKFKVNKKETEGRRLYELGKSQWDSPELRELLEHILPKRRVLNAYEITLDFPLLGRKTMLLNARQVDSKQLILLAIDDITEQNNLKLKSENVTDNLLKQRDKLQKLNDAKDEFIMLASHQLRTPATAVKQYVGMLVDGYAGAMSEEQSKMLTVAYKSNERQLEIIEDLLRVAKVDAGKVYLEKKPYDIGQQVETAMKEQAVLFENRGQTIAYNPPSKQVIVYGDYRLILMVIENILDNAGKYSQDGKQVIISIKQSDIYTSISIQDKGVGISKVDMKKLFEKFSRIDNSLSASVKGTGLGLYWAKKILDLHGGNIKVTSKINRGSIFTINTPTRESSALKLLVA
jgi:two-component system CheB/CheR fusion protein